MMTRTASSLRLVAIGLCEEKDNTPYCLPIAQVSLERSRERRRGVQTRADPPDMCVYEAKKPGA